MYKTSKYMISESHNWECVLMVCILMLSNSFLIRRRANAISFQFCIKPPLIRIWYCQETYIRHLLCISDNNYKTCTQDCFCNSRFCGIWCFWKIGIASWDFYLLNFALDTIWCNNHEEGHWIILCHIMKSIIPYFYFLNCIYNFIY
jgi:hypothetical protein